MKFDDGVASGRLRMRCSTTPAPDQHGRPAPRSTKGKVSEEVHRRWLAGSRQYAPWHYRREAMLVDRDGKLQLPTAAIKEQLHEIPRNYTAVDGISDKTRHRLLGNGWHWGVAGRLLQLLVASTALTTATAHPVAPGLRHCSGSPSCRRDCRWAHAHPAREVPSSPSTSTRTSTGSTRRRSDTHTSNGLD